MEGEEIGSQWIQTWDTFVQGHFMVSTRPRASEAFTQTFNKLFSQPIRRSVNVQLDMEQCISIASEPGCEPETNDCESNDRRVVSFSCDEHALLIIPKKDEPAVQCLHDF